MRAWVAADRLRSLHFQEAILSAAALDELAKLPRLEKLWISGPGVESRDRTHWLEDGAAEAIAGCKGLKQLYILTSLITDQGIKHLSSIRRLESLTVSSENITGESIDHLVGLEELKYLGLWRWSVDEQQIATLNRLPALEGVQLFIRPGITNASLAEVAKLDRLKRLNMNADEVTGDALPVLYSMTQLEFLDLSDTKVNKLGPEAAALSQALPNCTIRFPKTTREQLMERMFHAHKFGETYQLTPEDVWVLGGANQAAALLQKSTTPVTSDGN